MPCHEIVRDGQVVGHLCQARGETRPVPQRRKKRWWCFQCRQHLLHTYMGFYPTGLSYYGPQFWWACPRCHAEHIRFPGREGVYDE